MTINLSALQKQRRDTAANWTAENPTLLAGEIGLESDTGYWKVGDGSTAWTSLAYVSGLGAEIPVSRLADGTARQLLQTAANGNDVEWTSNVDVPGTLDVTGAATFDAAVTIQGNLTVNGTTTTIDTQNLIVEDKNVVIGQVTTPTDVTADGGGITLKGTTDKTINWVDATDAWTSSERFSVPTGTAGAPSLTFTGDPNTGIYSPGADQVAISTGGSGRLFVDANGSVKINSSIQATSNGGLSVEVTSNGTSSVPFALLNRGTSNNTGAYLSFRGLSSASAETDYAYIQMLATDTSSRNGALAFWTTNGGSPSEKLRITSGGLVGIGTSAPSGPLGVQVDTSKDVTVGLTSGSPMITYRNGSGAWFHAGKHPTSDYFVISDGATTTTNQRLVIDSSGRVGIGTTTAGAKLDVVESFATSALLVRLSGTTGGGAAINVTNGVTSTTPIYSFYYNGTTGIGNPAANVISAIIDGSERARIDSSGRFLVGTSSSLATKYQASSFQPGFQSAATTGTGGFFRYSADSDGPALVLSKSRNASTGSQTVVVDGDTLGYLGFTGSDGTAFQTAATILTQVDGTPGANDMPGRLVFSTTANGASSPTERMRIASNGNVGFQGAPETVNIGSTTTFSIVGLAPRIYSATTNTGNHIFACTTTGTIIAFRSGTTAVGSISVTGSATAYNTSSDYRLKENVNPVTDGITRLQQLKPSRFNFIADPTKTVDGFLAHEVQTIVPEAITGEKDAVDDDGNPQYQGIDQSKLVPLLTAALQEAIGRIESLEAEVAALKAQ